MKEKYLNDLQEIRTIMERSTRFLSLSGFSGIVAGTIALIGSYIAYKEIYYSETIIYDSLKVRAYTAQVWKLIGIGTVVLLSSVFSGIWFSYKKANKANQKLWTPASKKLIFSAMVPLIVGGLLILIFLSRGYLGIVAGTSLIFYGLALHQAGNYTFSDVKYLGILEMLVGLLAVYFPGRGLYFWAFGFGVLHIIYGAIMHYKYDRN